MSYVSNDVYEERRMYLIMSRRVYLIGLLIVLDTIIIRYIHEERVMCLMMSTKKDVCI